MINDKLLKAITQECLNCGQVFIPDESGQECCSNKCAAKWYGWEEDDCELEE